MVGYVHCIVCRSEIKYSNGSSVPLAVTWRAAWRIAWSDALTHSELNSHNYKRPELHNYTRNIGAKCNDYILRFAKMWHEIVPLWIRFHGWWVLTGVIVTDSFSGLLFCNICVYCYEIVFMIARS